MWKQIENEISVSPSWHKMAAVSHWFCSHGFLQPLVLKQWCLCFRRDFSTSANNIQIDKTKPLWHNYFLCGFKGIQVNWFIRQLLAVELITYIIYQDLFYLLCVFLPSFNANWCFCSILLTYVFQRMGRYAWWVVSTGGSDGCT